MFQKGDIVKIKSLEDILKIEGVEDYGEIDNIRVTDPMLRHFGREGMVVDVNAGGFTRVGVGNEELMWYYKPKWLDKVSDVMTIKDFEKEIMNLGFSVSIESTDVEVKDKDGVTAMTISSEYKGCVDTHWVGFIDIHDWDTKSKLLELGVKLASTPVDKRNVEAKYYLSLPEPLKHNASYLNLKLDTDTYVFSVKEETVGFQTKFTQEEIDDFPNQEFVQTLIKEEVK